MPSRRTLIALEFGASPMAGHLRLVLTDRRPPESSPLIAGKRQPGGAVVVVVLVVVNQVIVPPDSEFQLQSPSGASALYQYC